MMLVKSLFLKYALIDRTETFETDQKMLIVFDYLLNIFN